MSVVCVLQHCAFEMIAGLRSEMDKLCFSQTVRWGLGSVVLRT